MAAIITETGTHAVLKPFRGPASASPNNIEISQVSAIAPGHCHCNIPRT